MTKDGFYKMKKYYIYIFYTEQTIGPFNTRDRAVAYMKKHNVFGRICEESED